MGIVFSTPVFLDPERKHAPLCLRSNAMHSPPIKVHLNRPNSPEAHPHGFSCDNPVLNTGPEWIYVCQHKRYQSKGNSWKPAASFASGMFLRERRVSLNSHGQCPPEGKGKRKEISFYSLGKALIPHSGRLFAALEHLLNLDQREKESGCADNIHITKESSSLKDNFAS